MLAFFSIRKTIFIALMIALTLVGGVHADVQVTLQEPQWHFLLRNTPLTQTEARLAPEESEFAGELQPFLEAGDYRAVADAFAGREMAADSAALRLLRGQVLLSLERYEEAERALLAAIDALPSLTLAHRSLGTLYMLQKDYAKAAVHLAKTLELGLADAQTYGQLAYVNLGRGLAASAVSGYQTASFLEPDNVQWRQGLLYALISSRAYDQAQAILEEMLEADPDNGTLWLQRGQIALNQDRPVQALASMEHAFELGQRSSENLVIAAQLHIQVGSPIRAVSLLVENMQVVAARNRASDIDALDQIGSWLAYRQHWDELDRLMQALERGGIRGNGIYQSRFDVYRAQVAQHSGNRRTAISMFERALDADPANGEALLALATLLRDQNRPDAALNYYARAQALPAYTVRARLGRAQLEIDRQNYEEALRILQRVVQEDPSRLDVLTNIRSLENLVRQNN